jgi:hypothetical protein
MSRTKKNGKTAFSETEVNLSILPKCATKLLK